MFRLILFSFCFYLPLSQAFISEILEAKKKVESSFTTLETLTDTLEDLESITKIEKEYSTYEKELREFQKTLDEYERLGLDVKDFTEIRAYDPSSLRGQIDFFKNYFKRANNLIKSFQSLMQSPETLTAREQVETNRTLRALLEDLPNKRIKKVEARNSKRKNSFREKKKRARVYKQTIRLYQSPFKKKRLWGFSPFSKFPRQYK